MNATDVIRHAAEISTMVLKSYVSDLEDADLMKRPAPECNHLAWQLGHLISSECDLLNSLQPGAAAELPAGFAEKHSKETCGIDDPAQFCNKQEYLDLMDKVQASTFAALEKVSEADLDGPAPEQFKDFFPTAGQVYILIATHQMMHAGQFVPVRRALGKPVLM